MTQYLKVAESDFNNHPILFCIVHLAILLANTILPFTDNYHFAIPLMSIAVLLLYWRGAYKTWKRNQNEFQS